MNNSQKIVSSVLFFLFSFLSFFSQKEIILKRAIAVKCPDISQHFNLCDFKLLVPASRPGRQEVLEYKYPFIQPKHVSKTDDKEFFLVWKGVSLGECNKNVMQVDMKIKITPYDLRTAKEKPVLDKTDMDTLSGLKDEENFRYKAKSIQQAAKDIDGSTREEIVRKIFSYTLSHLEYKIFFFQDRGAKQALKEGKGDCTEYSELMVTLCRAKRIPARIVEGLIPHSNGSVGYHNWVEVYFPEYSWVAFDPTWADHPSSKTTFSHMKNTYVQTCNKRFLKSFICPCYGNIPFTVRLKDTCTDLSGITAKFGRALKYYENFESEKAGPVFDTLLIMEPDNFSFLTLKGMTEARKGNPDAALNYLDKAMENTANNEEKGRVLYAFANYFALKGDAENSMKRLKEAVAIGFTQAAAIETDKDFDKIRSETIFIETLQELKAQTKKE